MIFWRQLPRLLFLSISFAQGVMARTPRADCQLPPEEPVHLDIRVPSQMEHLNEDVLRAEDIGIRYAESSLGLFSGHFTSGADYERARKQCMETLFAAIALNHGMTSQEV